MTEILLRLPRRSLSLRVLEDGTVEIRAPKYLPKFLIRRFVDSKREWIEKTKSRIFHQPKMKHLQYQEGEQIRIGGKEYMFHLTKGNRIVPAGSKIFFPERYRLSARSHMEEWLRGMAKKILKERLDIHAKQMGVSYKKISIRDTVSRWGSCSSTGTISFSYRLILAKVPVIDYVVIHELAHISFPHHQKKFWEHVSKFCPEYKTYRAWLRTHGHTLTI